MPDTFTMAELSAYEAGTSAPATTPPAATEPVATPETPVTPAASEPATPDPAASSPAEVESPDVDVASADSTPAAPAGEPEAEPAAPSEEGDHAPAAEPAKGKGARERIEGLTDEVKALRAYAEHWRDVALKSLPATAAPAVVQTEAAPSAPAAPAAGDAQPALEEFGGDVSKWADALAAWSEKKIQEGISKATQATKQEQTIQQQRAVYEQKCEAFAKTVPDFHIVTSNPNIPKLAKDAAGVLIASDLAGELTYHLSKNPNVAARIARGTPAQQAAAIGRLEGELSAAKTAAIAAANKPVTPTPKKPTNNISKAPAPPTPVSANATPSVDPMSMSVEDFMAHERAQAIAKRTANRQGAVRSI